MANFIENSNRLPEYVESTFKTLITPTANFVATLTGGNYAVITLLGDDGLTYGTFTLDTLNEEVESGLLTALPARMRASAEAGSGVFNIKVVITP